MSRNITLRRALQLQKTLAGEISKLSATITKYNAQRTPNPHVNVSELMTELSAKRRNMVVLKTTIAQANAEGNIYADILGVSEMKAEIAFLEGLNVEEIGSEFVPGGGRQEYKITVAIDYAKRETSVAALKAELEAALERIDAFNTRTSISIDF